MAKGKNLLHSVIHKDKMRKAILFPLLVLFAVLYMPLSVHAAEAVVRFGSEWYQPENATTFPIGVYIESAENIGVFSVMMVYDPAVMTYIDGATQGGDGIVTITGDLQGTSGKFMLHFATQSEGDTVLTVTQAAAQLPGSEEQFVIAELPSAPIRITPPIEPVILSELSVNGVPVEALDNTALTAAVTIPYAEALEVTTGEETAYFLELSDYSPEVGENILTLTVSDDAGNRSVYSLTVIMEKKAAEEAAGETDKPEIADEEAAEDTGRTDGAETVDGPEVSDADKSAETIEAEGMNEIAEQGSSITAQKNADKSIYYIVVGGGVLVLLNLIMLVVKLIAGIRRKRAAAAQALAKQIEEQESDFQFESLYEEED